MLELTPIFSLAIIFGAIIILVYLGIRKKERMAMLERGLDASVFLAPQKKGAPALKYGTLLIGVALGILLGKILAQTEAFMYEEEAAYFSMIFLFGGISLVVSHFLERKFKNDEDQHLPEK